MVISVPARGATQDTCVMHGRRRRKLESATAALVRRRMVGEKLLAVLQGISDFPDEPHGGDAGGKPKALSPINRLETKLDRRGQRTVISDVHAAVHAIGRQALGRQAHRSWIFLRCGDRFLCRDLVNLII